jgi:hypothetical protein
MLIIKSDKNIINILIIDYNLELEEEKRIRRKKKYLVFYLI